LIPYEGFLNATDEDNSVAGLWLGLNSLCLILTIIEIILLARHKLKPATFVIMNSIKTGIWGTIFVFDIIAIAQAQNNVNYSRRRSAVGIVIEVLLLYVVMLFALISPADKFADCVSSFP
jgi:hypothetical protein